MKPTLTLLATIFFLGPAASFFLVGRNDLTTLLIFVFLVSLYIIYVVELSPKIQLLIGTLIGSAALCWLVYGYVQGHYLELHRNALSRLALTTTEAEKPPPKNVTLKKAQLASNAHAQLISTECSENDLQLSDVQVKQESDSWVKIIMEVANNCNEKLTAVLHVTMRTKSGQLIDADDASINNIPPNINSGQSMNIFLHQKVIAADLVPDILITTLINEEQQAKDIHQLINEFGYKMDKIRDDILRSHPECLGKTMLDYFRDGCK